jgi:hypothetical protein
LQISGIRARIIITVSASLLAMTVVLGIITYQTMSVRLIAQQKELLRQDSQFASMQFATFLKTIRNDTLMLASQVRLGGLDAALAAEHVEEWRSVMQAKPAYGGLSVVAADGRRLLELQRNGTDVTVIPVDGYQDSPGSARCGTWPGARRRNGMGLRHRTGSGHRPANAARDHLTHAPDRHRTAIEPGDQRGHRQVARVCSYPYPPYPTSTRVKRNFSSPTALAHSSLIRTATGPSGSATTVPGC